MPCAKLELAPPERPDPADTGMIYERCVMGLLRAYKLTLSPLIGRHCRFAPSCSEYTAQALIEHGPVRGTFLGIRRVCRCNPLGGSGYDPVPPVREKTSR